MDEAYDELVEVYQDILGISTMLIQYRDKHQGGEKRCSRKMNGQLEKAMQSISNALDVYEEFRLGE